MNLVVRRRLATGVLAATAVGVAGVMIASPASAGSISLSPNFAFNTDTKTITIVLGSGASPGYPPGSTVTFTRSGSNPPDSFSKSIDASNPDPSNPSVTVNFASVGGSGVGGDGPANPGNYDVKIAPPSATSTFVTDSCSACFTVLTPNTPTATSVAPNSLAQGGSGNVTVTGSGFSRGATIAVLLADGSGPDSSITANAAPTDSNGDITTGITSPTTIQRRWTVGPATATGPRDVRVTNTDGSSAVCPKCFTVNGAPLSAVSPTAGNNNPAGSSTRLTFSGSNLNSGTPSLAYVGDPGSATKSSLSITGTNVTYNGTSLSADFDLRNAAPGDSAYQPTVSQSDNSANACGCRFSVGQPAVAAITSLSKTSQTAGTTQTVRVTGSNFSKGMKVTVGGTGVTTTAVSFIDATQVDATFTVAANALNGPRDVTPTTTDGTAGTACKGCYTITGGSNGSPSASSSSSSTASASASSSASGSASPSSTACPTTSASSTARPTTSASATSSPRASATASGTASPRPSGSASATSSASPSSSASSGGGFPIPTFLGRMRVAAAAASASDSCASRPQLLIGVSPSDIEPTHASTIGLYGAPRTAVELYAYTRPNTTYRLVRSGTTDANGYISWPVTPGENTRLYGHYANAGTTTASDDSVSKVLNVHTTLSLSAVRTGVRQYTFQGRNLPRLGGQLITLYRIDNNGNEIRTANVRTDDSGTWHLPRTFTGSGTYGFIVRTGQTLNNAPGHSSVYRLNVH